MQDVVMDEFQKAIQSLRSDMMNAFDGLRIQMGQMSRRFDSIDGRLDGLDGSLHRLEKRVDHMDTRLDDAVVRIEHIEDFQEKLLGSVRGLADYVVDMDKRNTEEHRVFDRRITKLEKTVWNWRDHS